MTVRRNERKHMYRKLLLASIVLISAGVMAAVLADVPVKFGDLPPAVKQTIEKQANGNAVGGFSRERFTGKTVYEAEFEVDGHNKTVSIDPTGAVVEVEVRLEVDDLPGHVSFAIQKAKHMANLIRLVYQTTLQNAGFSER